MRQQGTNTYKGGDTALKNSDADVPPTVFASQVTSFERPGEVILNTGKKIVQKIAERYATSALKKVIRIKNLSLPEISVELNSADDVICTRVICQIIECSQCITIA